MISKKVILRNKLGFHARPASQFVRLAAKYKETEVEIVRGSDIVNGKSILGVMMLAAVQGTELEIRVDGPDEEKCVEELITLVDNKFYED